jgi:hypothetical protein
MDAGDDRKLLLPGFLPATEQTRILKKSYVQIRSKQLGESFLGKQNFEVIRTAGISSKSMPDTK